MCEKWTLITLVALSALVLVQSATLVDEMFGEALLNSITPELKGKLEEIHEKGTAKKYSTKQTMKLLKKRLLPEEIEELEKAYRRLLLPVLQSTLESKLRRQVDIDDVPMNIFDAESEEEILAEEEETTTKASRPKVEKNKTNRRGEKKGKKPRRDSPRNMENPKKDESVKEGKHRLNVSKSNEPSNTAGNKDEL